MTPPLSRSTRASENNSPVETVLHIAAKPRKDCRSRTPALSAFRITVQIKGTCLSIRNTAGLIQVCLIDTLIHNPKHYSKVERCLCLISALLISWGFVRPACLSCRPRQTSLIVSNAVSIILPLNSTCHLDTSIYLKSDPFDFGIYSHGKFPLVTISVARTRQTIIGSVRSCLGADLPVMTSDLQDGSYKQPCRTTRVATSA